MRQVLLIFALVCIVKVYSLVCTNPLRTQFKFTAPAIAQVAQGISYCKSLKNVESCCIASSFNTIQAQTDEIMSKLRTIVTARDKVLGDIRTVYLPEIINTLQRLKAACIRLQSQAEQNGQSESIADAFDGLVSIVDEVPKLRDKFIAYQKSRTVCVVQMAKLQAAAMCLACDGAYQSKGLTSGGMLSMSTNACTKLVDACYDYFAGTSETSGLLELKLLGPLIESLTIAMEKFSNGDMSGIEDYQKVVDGLSNGQGPSSDAEIPSYVPNSCTKESCDWICDTVFTNSGSIDLTVLGNGGEWTPSERRLLFQLLDISKLIKPRVRKLEEKTKARKLEEQKKVTRKLEGQTGGWDPDTDEAGVKINFEDDPSKTNEDSNQSRSGGFIIKSSIVCFVSVLVALFI